MILANVFKNNKWENVSNRLIQLYPDQQSNLDKYKKLFNIIPSIELEDVKNMRLCICCIKDEDKEWEDVFGIDDTFQKDYDGHIIYDKKGDPIKNTWALEFNSWSYWANLKIDKETLKNYNEIDIICHSMFEMTWLGFDLEDEKFNQEIYTIESNANKD